MSYSSIADFESDTGDISLSVPSSSSFHAISPSLSAQHSRATTPKNRGDDPTLLSKSLWPRHNGLPSSQTGSYVSLNRHSDDDPDVVTPRAHVDRPSSAAPRVNGLISQRDEDSEPVTPTKWSRQSSGSSLGRSRSLNIRMPSVDLSAEDGSKPGPMSATSTRNPSARLGFSRRPGEPRPPPILLEETSRRMSRWVKEIVVCNFDLERGPVVERRAAGRRWGPGEKENVAFSSFPDTSLFAEGSIMFSFKIRHIPPDPESLGHPEPPSPMPDKVLASVEARMAGLDVTPEESADSPVLSTVGQSKEIKAQEYRRWDERGREWLYGYVWFEQRKDKDIVRGYMQKSLVILTHLPFPRLFFAVLQRVGPAFFEHGYSAIEGACHSIASWPDPTANTVLELPLMSDVLTSKLPDLSESPQLGHLFGTPTLDRPLLVTLPHSSPLRSFATFLPALWSIWECLVLAEPVLVIAPDPKTCSEIVWWLRDLMRPIPPAGDFRPYLHIHDHDFSLLVNSNKPQPGVVVGVTNPFFRNAASHWPNVISVPSPRPRNRTTTGTSTPRNAPEQPDGFLSRRHRSVQKDRVLLKRLESLVVEGSLDDASANEALRTHFQQLTDKMLVPLNRYFQTLVPNLSSPSPAPSPAPSFMSSPGMSTGSTTAFIRPFSLPAFLNHLKTHGPNPLAFKTKGLTSKARVENDFYASFCMSPTFAGWLASRVESLGVAFAAQAQAGGLNTLAPPQIRGTPTRSSKAQLQGLGFMGVSGLREVSGSASDNEGKRMSSEDDSSVSAGGNWRESEESARGAGMNGPLGETYYRRRASEGLVKGYGLGMSK